jgi:hypothetical protein
MNVYSACLVIMVKHETLNLWQDSEIILYVVGIFHNNDDINYIFKQFQ